MSNAPVAAVQRVEREAAQAWEELKGGAAPAKWLELVEGMPEARWIKERTRLLTDLRCFLGRQWTPRIGNLTFGGRLMIEEVHGKLIDELEAGYCFVDERPPIARFRMYLQARDTLKTSILLPEGVQGVLRDKDETYAIVTYNQDASNQRLTMVSELLASPTALTYFPDSVWFPSEKRPKGTRNRADVLDLKSRRLVTAGTVEAVSRYSSEAGKHFSKACVDDLVNEEAIESERSLAKCDSTWRYLLGCVTVNVHVEIGGTFYADPDLYSDLIAEDILDSLWVVPAVVTEKWLAGYPDMRDRLGFRQYEAGQLLFPNRLEEDTLAQKRKMHGPKVFSSQFLLDPGAEAISLAQEWLKPFTLGEEPDGLLYYMTADPGVSTKEGASESALCCAGWSWDSHMWIVDFDAGLWSPDEFAHHACSMYGRWKDKNLRAFGMENVAFQRYAHSLIPRVGKEFGLTIRTEDVPGHHIGILGRIDNLVAAASAGCVHVERELVRLILPQWSQFPNASGRHMDRLDAISYQFARHSKRPMKGRMWVRLPPKPPAPAEERVSALPPSMRAEDSADRAPRPWYAVS